jgi:hypothetical protein
LDIPARIPDRVELVLREGIVLALNVLKDLEEDLVWKVQNGQVSQVRTRQPVNAGPESGLNTLKLGLAGVDSVQFLVNNFGRVKDISIAIQPLAPIPFHVLVAECGTSFMLLHELVMRLVFIGPGRYSSFMPIEW